MRKIVIVSLLAFFLISFSSIAGAANAVQFTATNVRFSDSNTLTVDGYFVNQGRHHIDSVNTLVLNVSYLTVLGWTSSKGAFQTIPVDLDPGESKTWTFNLTNTPSVNFSRWQVSTDSIN